MVQLSFAVIMTSILASVANAQPGVGFLSSNKCDINTLTYNKVDTTVSVMCPPGSGSYKTIKLDNCIGLNANRQLQWNYERPGFIKQCTNCNLIKKSYIACDTCGAGYMQIFIDTGILYKNNGLTCYRKP